MQNLRSQLRHFHIDEQTMVCDFADNIRGFILRSRIWLGALLAMLGAYYFFSNRLGATAFILTSVGTYIAIHTWAVHGKGVPLLPTIAAQHLLAYGLPVVVANEALKDYPTDLFTPAGVELIIFLLAMTASWYGFMQVFSPCKPVSYTLSFIRRGGFKAFRKIGLSLISFTTLFQLGMSSGMLAPLINALPQGSYPIINSILGAASMCGFFIGALGIGSGDIEPSFKYVFWFAFTCQCIVSAASLLLSSTTIYVASVMIGLFWSSGRFPWKFVVSVLTILSFFNLGKHEMRLRHWNEETGEMADYSLQSLPAIYSEWFTASVDMLTVADAKKSGEDAESRQTMSQRVNNLSNLLFVIDAMQNKHYEPLYGETYEIIPPLLIPRYFWPEKPRTHEGQIILNVHFGRQDLGSTLKTYIAWGLLPEAYGNFGPYVGALLLGVVMGLVAAWIERGTQFKAVLSMEGFALFSIFLGLATSYEMVASILITSIFQAVVTICMAVAPFVDRTVHKRPGKT